MCVCVVEVCSENNTVMPGRYNRAGYKAKPLLGEGTFRNNMYLFLPFVHGVKS